MVNIISVKVSKGGVGKTTIASNLSELLSLEGYRVLIIDFDSQANLSKLFVKNYNNKKLTSSNLLGDEFDTQIKLEDFTYKIEDNLDIITADIGLFEVSKYLENKGDYHHILKKKFNYLGINKKYDFIIFDLSPGVADTITDICLINSNLLLIPTHFDIDSLNGIVTTIDDIYRLKEANLINELEYLIVPNRYDRRFEKDNQKIFKILYENINEEFISNPIRENSHIKKARMFGLTAIQYEKDPNRKYEHKKAIEDFTKLLEKIKSILEIE